jgi:hypothetical protein
VASIVPKPKRHFDGWACSRGPLFPGETAQKLRCPKINRPQFYKRVILVTLRNFLMLVSDYYKVLGLDRSANGDAIKRAYRKIALKV